MSRINIHARVALKTGFVQLVRGIEKRSGTLDNLYSIVIYYHLLVTSNIFFFFFKDHVFPIHLRQFPKTQLFTCENKICNHCLFFFFWFNDKIVILYSCRWLKSKVYIVFRIAIAYVYNIIWKGFIICDLKLSRSVYMSNK